MTSNELRKKFWDFFSSKGHKIIKSDSLVPKDDPTVLFTTAGMNQFKKQFLGKVTDFKRAATSQKCLRTDDLDKVGKTAGHHTFFEMLGNFSFGDYFKKDAIAWAWEFLTETLKLSQDKLWVSVYNEDKESYDIWLNKIKIPKEKIIKLTDKENFWPSEAKTKGPNGPCGPCSEIFYDYGKSVGCGKKDCSPVCDCGRFVEVWNLVFTQFNRKPDATFEPLPNKNIDTGMGLERLAAVMQGVFNNFDTDLFSSIIKSIKKEADIAKPNKNEQIKIKIIADHIRAIVFAICDGVNPSNEDRGYIVRKLIRIGVNNYRTFKINKPFLYKIVPAVADTMKEAYPELMERRDNIAEIVKREEESCFKILNDQIPAFEKECKELKEDTGLSEQEKLQRLGEKIFTYHDTFGLPSGTSLEISTKYFSEKDVKLGFRFYEESIKEQKERSRQASTMGGDVFVDSALKLNLKNTKFNGYENFESDAKIMRILDKDNKEIKSTDGATDIKIILDKTPFYGESGGQIGDAGSMEKDNAKLKVLDTKKIDEVTVHIAKVVKGKFSVNDKVRTEVDCWRRLAIARNHTATHLLQAALRKVLGAHVQQQGSLVAEDRLRFDFTHFKAISKDELDRIEEVVNEFIRANTLLEVKQMSLDEAKKSGALAFFAEKYQDKVRVILIGDYSKELCGGTHLSSTGEIGLFKIITENSIAQGIRRIEAVTGEAAYKLMKKDESIIDELTDLLKMPKEKLLELTQKIINTQKNLEKKIDKLNIEVLKNSILKIISKAKDIAGVKLIIQRFDDTDMNFLRSCIDLLKQKAHSAVITVGSLKDDKVYIAMGITDDLVKKGLNASEMIKEIAKLVGGSGGGRADLAQAGGDNPSKLNEALSKTEAILKEKLRK